jgi:sodium/hydrogen exchanger-like protein 6/7
MVVGLIIRLSPGTSIQSFVTFDYQFFFNVLLPPIILASGYELHQVSLERAGDCQQIQWAEQRLRQTNKLY